MAHYYDDTPLGEVIEENFTTTLRGRMFSFVAASGLFSKHHVDNATRLLIEKCDLSDSKKILDLGCGWGPVSVVLASIFPDKEFVATDTNVRAVAYTRKNTRKYGLDFRVFKSNLFDKMGDETFDTILTNPPYVAGREVCFRFITESFDHLTPGGNLQLVALHQKGGKMLEKKMKETFGNVEAIAKGSGFRIYKSVKDKSSAPVGDVVGEDVEEDSSTDSNN